jgi:hypothetical protein
VTGLPAPRAPPRSDRAASRTHLSERVVEVVGVTRSPAPVGADASPSVWPCVCSPGLPCSIWPSSSPGPPIWMASAHFYRASSSLATALVPDCDADYRKRLPQPLAIGLADLISHCRRLRGHTLRPPATTSPASANNRGRRARARKAAPVIRIPPATGRLAALHIGEYAQGACLPKLPSPPRRHWVSIAEHGNGPMVAAFSGRPRISDRTPCPAPRIDHQLRAGGSAPRRRPSGGSELAAVHCWVPLNPS